MLWHSWLEYSWRRNGHNGSLRWRYGPGRWRLSSLLITSSILMFVSLWPSHCAAYRNTCLPGSVTRCKTPPFHGYPLVVKRVEPLRGVDRNYEPNEVSIPTYHATETSIPEHPLSLRPQPLSLANYMRDTSWCNMRRHTSWPVVYIHWCMNSAHMAVSWCCLAEKRLYLV